MLNVLSGKLKDSLTGDEKSAGQKMPEFKPWILKFRV